MEFLTLSASSRRRRKRKSGRGEIARGLVKLSLSFLSLKTRKKKRLAVTRAPRVRVTEVYVHQE